MGYFSQEPRADVARDPCGCGHGTQGHVAEPREPMQCLGGADAWQGPRESMRTPGWCHVAV